MFIRIITLFTLFILCNSELICEPDEFWSNSVICRPLGNLHNTLNDTNIYETRPNDKVIFLIMKLCKLVRIGSAPFKNFKDLQLLNLSNNSIVILEDDTFDGLWKLTDLNLSNNLINSINSNVFKPLSNLRNLDLSSNILNQFFDDGIFSGLTLLSSLDLSNNIQLTPPSELFKGLNLRSLTLSNSNIVFPDTYALNMSNLIVLDLSNNTDVFESGYMGDTLSSCVDLINLKMVGIKLSAIGASSLKLMKKLLILNLSDNQLDKLDQDVFNGIPEVMNLNLSSNRIESLPSVIFRKTVKIAALDLSKNRINTLQTILFATLEHLRKLDLSNNQIDALSDKVFAKNIHLETLLLNNNKIHALKSSTFSTNKNVRTLDLGNNKLKTIDFVVVQNLPHLQILNLENNILTGLTKEFFSKESLKELNLACNQMISLPNDTFPFTERNYELNLYFFGNHWSCRYLNNLIKEKSKVKIYTNGFSDGRYVSCITDSNSTICENQISEEDRQN